MIQDDFGADPSPDPVKASDEVGERAQAARVAGEIRKYTLDGDSSPVQPSSQTRCLTPNLKHGAAGTTHLATCHGMDGLPTRLIILLISPFKERELHSELMGRLASLMYNKTLQYSLQNSWTLDSLFRALAL